MKLFSMVSREALLNPNSTLPKAGAKSYQYMLPATPADAVIAIAGNSHNSSGHVIKPVNQALQKHLGIVQHYQQAHIVLAQPGHTVQMLDRLGYGPSTTKTPR